MSKKRNIVVIGTSKMAQLHMEGVTKAACLYGICDNAPEQLAAAHALFPDAKTCADYRDFVNDPQVDAAVIVTPDYYHLEMTAAFLRAGKDVLCEKPMALTQEECEEMMAVERETGRKLMIGQICRCTPGFVAAHDLVARGAIGDLFFVESEYAHNYDHAKGYNNWRVDPRRHAFIGGGCHAVDLLRWIAGDPEEVFAYSNHKCLTDWPVDDCTVALLRFPNGVSGKVFASIGCKRNYTMRSVFYGTKGTIICDNTSDHITLFEDNPAEGKSDYTQGQIIPVDVNNHNAAAEIEAFIRALNADDPMPIGSYEGAATVAVCCAAMESSRTGAPVRVRYPRKNA